MKKYFKYFLFLIMVAITTTSTIKAKSVCDTTSFNNSETTCNSNSNCTWVIDNEDSGSGHCKLKDNLPKCDNLSVSKKDEAGYCLNDSFEYEVEVFNSNIEGNYARCTFKITTDRKEITEISWNDPYSKKSGTFNAGTLSFPCAGKTINFWNTNLTGTKLEQETNNIVIADFKNNWIKIYKETNETPELAFSNITGNYYIYFIKLEKGQPIYNTGGTYSSPLVSGQDNNKNNSDVEDIKNAFLGTTSCGGIQNFQFPNALPKITSFIYNIFKIAIPIILIVKGSLDMFKAVSSQKEDEMKKAQKKFTQRLIAGFLAFFVLMIVETVINFIANKTGNDNAMDCVNCFIKGSNYCTKD